MFPDSHPKFGCCPVVVSMRRGRVLYESLRKSALAPGPPRFVDRKHVITIFLDPSLSRNVQRKATVVHPVVQRVELEQKLKLVNVILSP